MPDSPISGLTRATTIGNNDLFVLEQGGQAKALSGQTFVEKLTEIADGHGGIVSIAKTGTDPNNLLADIYTITFADETTSTFSVTNGEGIDHITAVTTPSQTTTRASDVVVSVYLTSNPFVAASTFTIPGGDTGSTGVGQKIHIMYSAVEPTQDSDMTNVPSAWMGIAINLSNTAPVHYTSYTWNYIKGEQGEQGIQGLTGAFIWRADVGPTIIGNTTFFIRTDVYGPITGVGFQEDPVYGDLLIWGGTYYSVSRVTLDAQYGKVVEVSNPYTILGNGIPAGGTTGQVLKKSSNSDFAVEWGTGGGGGSSDYDDLTDKPSINSVTLSGNKTSDDLNIKEPFYATVGTTTVAQIDAAWTAGKVIFCKTSDGTEILPLVDRESSTEYVFRGISAGNTLVFRTCDSNGWSSSTISVPTPQSSGTPAALGTAARGTATTYARSDHVHPMPTAANVGAVAVAQGVAHAGEFVVVGSDGNITTVTMTAWSGGNY